MSTKLFIMLPYYSHITPTFGLASELKKNGDEVIYSNFKSFENLITNQGFNFITFSYLEEYRVPNLKTFFSLLLISILNKQFKIKRYSDFLRFSNLLESIIKITSPCVIYLDEYIAEYYLILKKLNIHVIILNTRCSTQKKKNIPPLNSSFIPQQNVLSFFYCEYLWLKHFVIQKIKDYSHFLCFLGVTETFFWKRVLRKNKFNYAKIISRNHCLNKSINEINTINLVPETFEFQFSQSSFNESYLHIPYKIKMDFKEKEIWSALKKEIRFQKCNGKKILIASFGTIYTNNSSEVHRFLEMLIEIISEVNNIFLIILSKNRYALNRNIMVLEFIPLSNLIEDIDLMLNHGGIGTIKECIENKVPMIVLPLNKKTDQPGCGARTVSNGLGKVFHLNKLNKNDIKNSIFQQINCV